MNITVNARDYDWATWLIGIWRAVISGGSSAVVGGFSNMVIDPDHFNLAGGLRHTLSIMGTMFFIMGLIQMFVFLQTHAAPDKFKNGNTGANAAVKPNGGNNVA